MRLLTNDVVFRTWCLPAIEGYQANSNCIRPGPLSDVLHRRKAEKLTANGAKVRVAPVSPVAHLGLHSAELLQGLLQDGESSFDDGTLCMELLTSELELGENLLRLREG